MTKFQLAVIIIFGLAIVGGVIAFSVYKGGGQATADISVWGTLPTNLWNSWYASSPIYGNKLYNISYTFIPDSGFDSELVNAIAEGRGPDVVLAFHERILKNQAKLYVIPFESFSQRDFQNDFIEGAAVLATPKGYLGVPLVVDPLVLYYNRDIFTNASLISPPALWADMYTLAANLTTKNVNTGAISQSAIPLGSYNNVLYAKPILATMVMQAGGRIVEDTSLYIRATLTNTYNLPYGPGNAALLFFTEFSNPAKIFYTWNRSLPDSLTQFAAGDSAMFVGLASDLQKIRDKNPNLSFDAARLPQSSGSLREITYGRFLTIAVTKATFNPTAAFGVAFEMMSTPSVSLLSGMVALPPARRDLLKTVPADPFAAIFYDSAIRAVAWKDPDTEATDIIFKNMIENVTSGRLRVEEAVNRGQAEFQTLLENLIPQASGQNI